MTPRSLITVGFVVLCGAALWGILAQGHQVSELRAEEQRLESERLATNDSTADTTASPAPEVPRELLQLRAEVARLSQQQRDLSGARAENERLRLQLENRRTNGAGGAKQIPPGYIRASQAKWLGYNTPEDTFQSLFWAVSNHNLEKFLEATTSEASEEFRRQISQSGNPATAAEEFFKAEGFPPGFAIIGREQIADDTMALRIQFIITPDFNTEPRVALDASESLQFKRIAGQWKLSKTH